MIYKNKCCNTESKVNDIDNFYVIRSTPTLCGHAQRKKCISTNKKYKQQLSYTNKGSLFYNCLNMFVDPTNYSASSSQLT